MAEPQKAKGVGLRFDRASFSYGNRRVLNEFDLQVEPAEVVALLGPSGCGKTTIIHLAAGFLTPTSGVIRLDGHVIEGAGPDRAVVSQEDSIFPWLTVLDNVMFGSSLQALDPGGRRAAALDWLSRIGLTGLARSFPWQLSGGMRQRVALGRAWANGSPVLLLDEPLRSLDWPARIELQGLVRSMAALVGQTVLLVTHDPDEAIAVADRVVVLDRQARVISAQEIALAGDSAWVRRLDPRFARLSASLSDVLHAASRE